jgi:hypothetical protein
MRGLIPNVSGWCFRLLFVLEEESFSGAVDNRFGPLHGNAERGTLACARGETWIGEP